MAKLERYGGNPNCIVAVPQIGVFQLSNDTDFILLGSDGIFDNLDNKQIKSIVQNEARELSEKLPSDIQVGSFEHVTACCGAAVNAVMRNAMEQESTDNLSVVLLVFQNFKNLLNQFQGPPV